MNTLFDPTSQFFAGADLPLKLPVSGVMVFIFIGNKLILHSNDANGWSAIGGKVELGEDFEEAGIRYGLEQVGASLSRSTMRVVGYIKMTSSIVPVLTSFVSSLDEGWKQSDLNNRGLFKLHEAAKLISHQSNKLWLKVLGRLTEG